MPHHLGLGRRANLRNPYSRASDEFLSKKSYFLLIVLSINLSYIIAVIPPVVLSRLTIDYLMIVGIAIPLTVMGVLIALKAGRWLTTFMSYLLFVAAPLGALAMPLVNRLEMSEVLAIGLAIVAATFIFGLSGFVFPFTMRQAWPGELLTLVLWILAGVMIFRLMLHNQQPNLEESPLIHLILADLVVLISINFSRAKSTFRTVDDAIDASMLFFLDSVHILRRPIQLIRKVKKTNSSQEMNDQG